jgi:hypothetical protein
MIVGPGVPSRKNAIIQYVAKELDSLILYLPEISFLFFSNEEDSGYCKWATTNMQAWLRCKRASKPLGPLSGDPTVDANLCMCQGLIEKFHEVVGGFKCQICIYGWIPIQRPRGLLACLHLSLACILVVAL